MDDNKKLLEQVNRSGFPLQLAVKRAILNHSWGNGWNVYSQEHSWKNEFSGASGFIDLVLIDDQSSVMIVECKRVINTNWIFLINDSAQITRSNCTPWITHVEGDELKTFSWVNLPINPISAESSFCVVAGQDPKSRPLLERLAAEANEATEAFAREDLVILRGGNNDLRLYYNVIVTTAELVVCEVQSDAISLASGTLDSAHFSTIPYIRFRKQLSVNRPIDPNRRNYVAPFREKENTVFVVNSNHLLDFLDNYHIDDSNLMRVIRS